MKKKELKDRAALLEIELVALRDQMRILVEETDSPEAAAIRLQWQFAKEIEKAYESGKPVDTPKLMGLYGAMFNTTPKSGLTDTERLDALQKLTMGYGDGWVLRTSRSGRGMRLHETSGPEATPSVRDAIDKYINIDTSEL